MRYPTEMLKILALQLFFFGFFVPAYAAEPILLTKVEKQERVSSTRITFHLSRLPAFKVKRSGQRLDLEFTNVRTAEILQSLPEDEKILKFLLAQKHSSLLVSTLLRRPPIEVETTSLSDPVRVVVDLFWAGDQSARPGVAFRVSDMPARKTGKKANAFGKKSPWQDDWLRFFRDYHSDWQLTLPVVYSQPKLPQLVTDKQSPLWLLQMYSNEKMWLSVLRESSKTEELDEQQAYLWRLLVAEAQLFSGGLEAGSARLQALQEEDGSQQVRVDYLTAYAQAASGQSYVAQLQLQELLTGLPHDHFLIAPIFLLAAETALASNQDRLAINYLHNSEINWPDSYLIDVELRTADARSGLGELTEAVAIYAELLQEAGLFEFHSFSCDRAAFTAFKSQDYRLSRQLYRKLFATIKDDPGGDLAIWGLGAATYLAGDLEWGVINLEKASLEYPLTEGGERAELMLIDHKIQTDGEMGVVQASEDYSYLGKRAGSWKVREEATFKHALGLYLIGDNARSVDVLMSFLREFSSTSLKREARLILLEQIPIVVKRLLKEKKELEAVVLVEKNRDLLLHGGPDRKFLNDLAKALERIGLYERSARVLLFLYDQAKDEKQRQPLYLPLARSFFKRDEYDRAADYADRYLKKYPRGADRGALFGVLLDAFAAQQRDEELLAWLGRKNRPHNGQLERRAAAIYWQQQRYADVVTSLEWIDKNDSSLQVKEMALLGEAYYQLDKNSAAKKIFSPLQNDSKVGTQARYRTAQLMLRQKQRGAALKLLRQLVEEDGNSSWGKLAQDLLSMENNKGF